MCTGWWSCSSLFTWKLLHTQCTNALWLVENYLFFVLIDFEIGGRVDGALGDVRDRSGKEHNLSRWALQGCPTTGLNQSRKSSSSILECSSDNDVSKSDFRYSIYYFNNIHLGCTRFL